MYIFPRWEAPFSETQRLVVVNDAPGPGAAVPLLPPAPGVTTGPGIRAQHRPETCQQSKL